MRQPPLALLCSVCSGETIGRSRQQRRAARCSTRGRVQVTFWGSRRPRSAPASSLAAVVVGASASSASFASGLTNLELDLAGRICLAQVRRARANLAHLPCPRRRSLEHEASSWSVSGVVVDRLVEVMCQIFCPNTILLLTSRPPYPSRRLRAAGLRDGVAARLSQLGASRPPRTVSLDSALSRTSEDRAPSAC